MLHEAAIRYVSLAASIGASAEEISYWVETAWQSLAREQGGKK